MEETIFISYIYHLYGSHHLLSIKCQTLMQIRHWRFVSNN